MNVAQLKTELEEANVRNAELQRQIHKKEQQIRKLKGQVGYLAPENRHSKQTNANLQARNEELVAQHNDKQKARLNEMRKTQENLRRLRQ
jgi:regulator of replication initiation timing